MYWPLGAPRVYASDRQQPSRLSIENSDDSFERIGDADAEQELRASVDHPADHLEEHGTTAPKQTSRDDDETHHQSLLPETQDVNGVPLQEKADKWILDCQVARNGQLFVTITKSCITVWQTQPVSVLACIIRSSRSLISYGVNEALLLRPDSAVLAVQTSLGFLITYALAVDPNTRVYRPMFDGRAPGSFRRSSTSAHYDQLLRHGVESAAVTDGLTSITLRFRMAIKIDAGISHALALEHELVVATQKPAAVQCIRWTPDHAGSQTSTELLKRMSWMSQQTVVVDMVYDRPMNLFTWITEDGKAYAVQRRSGALRDSNNPNSLFKGYLFHVPDDDSHCARKAAINARFSHIALGLANGQVAIYVAKDYSGQIPLSHIVGPIASSHDPNYVACINYSPDGYCLLACYNTGWATWSVYGQPGASSFRSDVGLSQANDERWLTGIRNAAWIGGGSEILFVGDNDERLWMVEVARGALAGCFSTANISRCLLQTRSGFIFYRGYDFPDLTDISTESSLWQQVQCPPEYLNNQWPLRAAVISSDGKYVAVAGKRGLAHYSIKSGRWKTFYDLSAEDEFSVRGGMCWHQHILIAAVEASDTFEIRLYSRESSLDYGTAMHIERMAAPIVVLSHSGDDSLLVYSYENILYHYVVTVMDEKMALVQVGQIAFHGIIRAPPRVRAVSWILPEHQTQQGDPSQDVAVASVVFLVDAKLVLLQPSTNENGELKYDMRVIAHNVEYFVLMRDQVSSGSPSGDFTTSSGIDGEPSVNRYAASSLRDSLWYFDGTAVHMWTDIQDLLNSLCVEDGKEASLPIKIPVDFWPLSCLLDKGIIVGIESEFVQRRDFDYALCRFATRTQLFLPPLLRHFLLRYDSPTALHLCQNYQHLPYFQHVLEVLLHNVLDQEVDAQLELDASLLPTVLSFISSFPSFLQVIVQCTRKTEVRSWKTLFAHLPSPKELFEAALQGGDLKTAGGYLLVLHTFEEYSSSRETVRLLKRAKNEGDWELCKELARFLMALDESGTALREAVQGMQADSPAERRRGSRAFWSGYNGVSALQGRNGVGLGLASLGGRQSPVTSGAAREGQSPGDYFATPVE